MNNTIKGLLSQFLSLPEHLQESFLKAVLAETKTPNQPCVLTLNQPNNPSESVVNIRFKDGLFCPHCGDTVITKRGKTATGKQRYLCKACNHTFTDTTNTTLQYTKKHLHVWLKYIECMANQYSVRKSARICGISIPTSFNWRHKILDSLRNRYFNKRPKLSGIIEADETYFHLSFKGNKELEKVAGRKAHKRGNSIKKRGLSKEQVCVPCAVSIRGGAFAQVGKLGTTNLSALSMTLGNRIEPKSVLCSDNLNIYREFCARHHLEHNCSGLKHVAKLLDAQGGNIQHINGYHSSMKRFIRPFNGVATKYLNNYLVWYNESRDVGYNEHTLSKNIRDGVYVEEIYTQRDFISLRPPVPMVA
jgi:transposase-like protein